MKRRNDGNSRILFDPKQSKPIAAPKQTTQSAADTSTRANLAPITLTLGLGASELVRWYCQISHHQEADAIEGALIGLFERARAAYEESSRIDEAFDWLLADVLSFMQKGTRRTWLPWGGGVSLQLSPEASGLLHRWRPLDKADDIRDVVSGAVVVLLGSALNGETSRALEECIQRARRKREATETGSDQDNTAPDR